MKFLGSILIYFGLYIVYANSLGNPGHFSTSGFLLSLVFAAPLLASGAWLTGRHEREQQAVADDQASRIAVSADETAGPFFLYLRPFDSTNAYRITDSGANLFSWEIWERDGFDDIERLVARALNATAPVIALGKPGEHRGAGRILTTKDNWKVELAKLAKKATLVVIVPSHRAGTLWELELLVSEGYLGKTIFIMPPGERAFYTAGAKDAALEWSMTQAACMSIGLLLPNLSPGGALFKVAANGVYPTVALPRPDPVAWMKAMQSLIDQ